MIKVRLVNPNPYNVRLKPKKGIKVNGKTVYLYDPDQAEKYIGLAKDWAIKMDGKVQEDVEEIDYSSKYYANQSKQSSESAEESKESASESAATATQKAQEATDSADEAERQAGLAETSATSASNSATTATTQAGISTNQATIAGEKATIATTQAGIATTKAQESKDSADDSAESAGESADYSERSRIWAEGDTEEVQPLGGEDSSKGFAGLSYAYANADEDVPVEDFAEHHSVTVKGEKGDKGDKGDTGEQGPQGIQGDTGENGQDGQDGQDGADGFSPSATVTQSGGATTISITDKDGTTTASVTIPTDTNDLTNGAGYITSAALSGYATQNWVVGQGYLTGITSGMVTTALGYTPYDSSNPNGFITSASLPTNFVGTDGADDGAAGLVPAPMAINYGGVLKADGTWGTIDYSEISNTPSIPTSADYWTVGTQGVSNYQTTYSKKMIFYKQANAQDNGFRMLGDSDTSPGGTTGAWSARCLIGNENRTFLLGTARNSASGSQSICGIGAHTWVSASSQTSAAWDNIYIQPDGSTAVYLGGYGWRGSSGWMRVQNNGNGSAAYRVEINTGTNNSTAWKKVLPNNATGTSSILFTPTVSTTHTYTYATSVNGTVTANYGTSYGYGTTAAGYATALGYNAKATGSGSIQLGQGTNSTANTLYVGLTSSLNVELLDTTGKIPIGRIDLTQITGYDSTVAQTLKHSAGGGIEWVND